MSDTLGSLPFWRLVKSSFRNNSTPEEAKRADGVVRWVCKNKALLGDSLEKAEMAFLTPIIKGFETYGGSTFTPQSYMDQVEDDGGKIWKLLSEMHEEFEDLNPDLTAESVEGMPIILRQISSLAVETGIARVIGDVKKILTSDPAITVQGEHRMTKAEKALTYMKDQVIGIYSKQPHLRSSGDRDHDLTAGAGTIQEDYTRRRDAAGLDTTVINLGIPPIDEAFQFKRGHLVGVLGFAGHRKSTLSRTWAYNAAFAGHSVVHFALEMGFDDEVPNYYLMHCKRLFEGMSFCKADYMDGKLPPDVEEIFEQYATQEAMEKDLAGRLLYRQRGSITWEELAREIDDLIESHGITMVVVDYLTLVKAMGKGTNNREAIDMMIQNVKPFCESRKILFVTPIQGNRDGLNRCIENGGAWDASGIDTYSGYFRACDSILGVYSPRDSQEGEMIISSVKNRHGSLPPLITVTSSSDVGYVTM